MPTNRERLVELRDGAALRGRQWQHLLTEYPKDELAAEQVAQFQETQTMFQELLDKDERKWPL